MVYGVTLYAFLHLVTIPLGILYSQILEWVLHKYILHGLGKNKNSSWSAHWHTHHKSCRKNNNYDKDYRKGFFDISVRSEILGLSSLCLLHIPLMFIIPIFYLTLILCSFRYYYLHKKAHLNPEWGKKYLPWHYDHHMGKNQNANWGVTTDWVDRLMRTRIQYFK